MLTLQVKKRGAQRLHWDVSYKVEKHVAQFHGKPLYKGLLTATNEVGEARASLLPPPAQPLTHRLHPVQSIPAEA